MDLTTQDLPQIRGKPLYSSEGEKIGDIEDVFLDDQSHRPEWVRIGVGLLGMKNVLVPIEAITREGDGLKVSYSKDKVKDAPKVDANYISPEEEGELYQYYGLQPRSPSELNEARGAPGDELQQRTPATPPSGAPPAGERQGGIGVPEEQTLAARGRAEPGNVRLRKWVGP